MIFWLSVEDKKANQDGLRTINPPQAMLEQ